MTNKQYNKIKTQVDRVERLRQNYEAGKDRLESLLKESSPLLEIKQTALNFKHPDAS